MKHVPVGSAPSPATLPAVKFARRARLKSICGRAAASVSAGPVVEPYKVSLVQLGCPKNTTDAEVLLGDLVKSGFQVTEELESSDAVIVNTCAFVEAAKAESLEAILGAAALKEDGTVRKVVVTGCLAQRYSQDLAESLPEADHVVGFEAYSSLPSMLQAALSGKATAQQPDRVQVGQATVGFRNEADRYRLTPRHWAYLRVGEGCNHSCTFCAIPGFRGRFRSKPWAAVLEEARKLVDSGAVELNLIAEDTNQYGMDRRDGRGLAGLLRELGKLEGLRWIRLLYCYPSYFTEDLIDEIASNPKVVKYIDIPLQHWSNLTLLSMNRPPQAHTRALLQSLRDRIPGLVLRTTFISGFPGETEADHRELLDFCAEWKFERMGVFAYSEEDGTPAASFPEQVPEDVRAARRDELTAQQQEISSEFAESLIGREIEVLVEGADDDNGHLWGRTQWDAPDCDPIVFLAQSTDDSAIPPLQPGQVRTCIVNGSSVLDLEASPIC